ncbi:MAG: 2-hydroxyacid dehydrogenase [Caldisphaeraceae archaeon]|nr:2-hydroxyacid dehydrogenase [Caldisphaeraceae archaeon]
MESKKIVVSMSPLPASFIESLFTPYKEKLNLDLEVISVFNMKKEEIVKVLENADIVIGDYSFQMKIDKELCKAMKKVKLIQQPSTGFDHIDINACSEMGIPVSNAGRSNSISVAEYTVMTALALLKRLAYANKATSEGEWPQWKLMDLGTYDLYGKTWGLVGFGRIGREVAKRVNAFGAKLLYYDIKRLSEEDEKNLNATFSRLPRLLRSSDIVSVHTPLTEETRDMFSEKELRSFKPGAILINPSRGELVDENALANAIKEGWIAGAAVDVYSDEPPSKNHPLLELARSGNYNVIVTPHIAGANTDARTRIIEHSIGNVVRVLIGEKPEAVVNR